MIATHPSEREVSTCYQSLMRGALREAVRALDAGEAPIGCVLASADGRVVAAAHNTMRGSGNLTAHAEIVTFAAARGRLDDARGAILVSTLEPCVMCFGAACETGIATVVYGLKAPADGGAARVQPPVNPGASLPAVVGGVLAAESRHLFHEWLHRHQSDRSRATQRAFIEQLLRGAAGVVDGDAAHAP